jgi:hypothetical protein
MTAIPSTMKAVRRSAHGGLDLLQIADRIVLDPWG